MSAIKLSTPSSGSISLSPANTASNLTITVPAVTGTMAIEGPAFSAYLSGDTGALTAGVYTKVGFQTEEFDTNSNYSSSRFTPTVAGYYQISAGVSPSAFSGNYFLAAIYKNGGLYKNGSNFPTSNAGGPTSLVSSVVYLNGSTDYVEIYAIANGTPILYGGYTYYTYFNGVMVRGA